MMTRRNDSKIGVNRRTFFGALMSMLILTGTIPFIYHSRITDQEDEVDAQVGRIVRSLNSVQMAGNNKRQSDKVSSVEFVQHNFPWLIQNNTLPNFYLSDGLHSDRPDEYHNNPFVFLHHHRSAGTAIKTCLRAVAAEYRLAKAPPLTSDDRYRWESEVQPNSSLTKIKIHVGQFSYGMCRSYKMPCSYFTILRDPLDRAVSSYEYCKTAQADEMCKVFNANDNTLKDWIIHQGSIFFLQLMFNPEWCKTPQDSLSDYNNGELPCWYKQKLQLDQLSNHDKMVLIEYLTEALEDRFSVIGLYEEFETSLNMLSSVYKLPFTSCKTFRNNQQNSEIFDNRSSRKRRSYPEEDDPVYLQHDYQVQQALKADYMLYRKAKQLFHLQRQILMNKISS